jgi:hypothetical protein
MSAAGRLQAGALLVAAWLCAGPAAPAWAEGDEQVVYWPLVTDGSEYRRVSYPEEAGALVVLADTEVVLDARLAAVSYWPITREYVADLTGDPRVPPGRIEITDPSGASTILEPQPYVLWYPRGAAAGPSELVHGEAARPFYEDYVRSARTAAEKLREYERVVAEHRALVEAWVAMAGERAGQNLPPPPPELKIERPEPYQAFATEPREAAVVTLPQGIYHVQLRSEDGQVVPGSRRELLSIAPLGRGTGYVLRPEDRWTQPAVSFAPDEIIYTTGAADLFVQPVPVAEFQARDYTRLFEPQSVQATDPSLTVWVPGAEPQDGEQGTSLALMDGGRMLATVPRRGYRVNQLAGSGLGYSIDEFAAEAGSALQPDLTAMRLEAEVGASRIRLVEGPDGNPVAGSDRELRVVNPPPEPMLFLPALLPVALGLGLRAASSRRARANAGRTT